jgi:RND family efflux transporter MFP subunit
MSHTFSVSAATVALGVIGAASLALSGCGHAQAKHLTDKSDDLQPVSVTVAPVELRPVVRSVEAVGTIDSFEEVVISAKVEGRVRRIAHDVSDRVKAGETLLEIDPVDHDLAARQAEKALQIELAKLGVKELPRPDFDVTKVPAVQQAHARLENSKLRLERVKTLAAKQASSAEELADRTADSRVMQAEYDNQLLLARAILAGALMKQESLAMAKQQLADTTVRSPTPTQEIPGVNDEAIYTVSDRAVAEGTLVRPGTQLFTLVIDKALKMKASVAERYVREIKIGQRAKVFTASSPQPVIGHVTRITPIVDPQTRTFEVEVLVPNSDGALKPGGFAKTAICVREEDRATTVPLEAVVRFAGVTKIFVLENGAAKELQVKLGLQSTQWVEVVEPAIAPEAQVVTSGQNVIAAGTPLVVRQAYRADSVVADAHADAKR